MSEILSGSRVRYVTKRHGWEIVRESINTAFYSAMIVATVLIAWGLFGIDSLLWGMLALIFPAGYLWAELVRWDWITYAIIDGEDGGTYVRKTDRKFNPLKGNPEKIVEPAMKFETLVTRSNLFQRWIGFASMELKIGDAEILSGERIPLEFAKKLREKKPSKPKSDDVPESVMLSALLDLKREGIFSEQETRVLATRIIGDTV